MQTALTILILTLAVGYALWRFRRTLQGKNHTCAGCEGCPFKDEVCQKQEKDDCCAKKSEKHLDK